ncbi:ATP-binding protein [Streptomyces venezuelae]|uniref:ATP-binding protein n=2 Tax=Streptomyces venezuelae TaxID=54571 RepID=A0A5P2AV42_STRVZ|nr:ATP-binding protein [Streptomyces venezuelae]
MRWVQHCVGQGGSGVVTFSERSESGLRSVLPFEAVPGEVRLLREAVRSKLGQWGALQAVDEAELVVTELATNVIKHVGEGAPATLVLEWSGSRLRVELHDKSPVVPVSEVGRPRACDAECGRGLRLLVSMSADWGAFVTGPGKVVWCELPLVTDALRARASRASAVLDGYRELAGIRGSTCRVRSRVDREAATALITDLMAWLASHGSDPDDALACAQQLYEAGEAAA